MFGAPCVARLIKVKINFVAGEVDDVDCAGAVDVGKANAAAVKQIVSIEAGCLIHRDLGAKAAVTKIRPVTNFSEANANQVSETVARHVGEEDGFGAVGEDQLGAFFLVEGLCNTLGGPEAVGGKRFVPPKGLVFA